jgi:uncharacterized protein (TIGR02118 family)
MSDRSVVHVVAVDCAPQEEEKLNEWYNNVHIPMLMKFKGLQEVDRYKILTESSDRPKYIAVYKFSSRQEFEKFSDSQERQAAIAERKESWPNLQIQYKVLYELIKTFKR